MGGTINLRIYTLGVLFLLMSGFSITTYAAAGDKAYLQAKKNYDNYNYKSAFRLYKQAADKGNPLATVALSRLYERGEGIKLNRQLAKKYGKAVFAKIDKLSNTNNIDAQFYFGYLMLRGYVDDNKSNPVAGLHWFTKAAEKGHMEAMFTVGSLYINGIGTKRNVGTAARWFGKAADKGHVPSMYMIGMLYHHNNQNPKNKGKDIAWLKKAADKGHAEAMVALGTIYAQGKGVPRDFAKTMSWFKKAAKKGDANAMASVGAMYERGLSVPVDKGKAAKWYTKASDKGNVDAMNRLGEIYRDASGVKQDMQKAYVLFRAAAEKGNKAAKANFKRMGGTLESDKPLVIKAKFSVGDHIAYYPSTNTQRFKGGFCPTSESCADNKSMGEIREGTMLVIKNVGSQSYTSLGVTMVSPRYQVTYQGKTGWIGQDDIRKIR